ncbi:hypothetical protein KAJ61_00645 [Candidatus Parcubacteria bacterium]|nr:hypothetical protein [Candidatus Parcubacteria bacterium]
MNYKKTFLYLIIFLLAFALGGIAGGFFVKNKINIEKQNIYSNCWDDARKELIGVCRPPTSINENALITNFYGKLISVNMEERQIIIDPAPLGDGEDNILELILQITDSAKIEQIVKKDDAQYQKELEEYNINYEKDESLVYPMKFVYKQVDFVAFQTGQIVTITSREDVRNKKQVEAVKIVINY